MIGIRLDQLPTDLAKRKYAVERMITGLVNKVFGDNAPNFTVAIQNEAPHDCLLPPVAVKFEDYQATDMFKEGSMRRVSTLIFLVEFLQALTGRCFDV